MWVGNVSATTITSASAHTCMTAVPALQVWAVDDLWVMGAPCPSVEKDTQSGVVCGSGRNVDNNCVCVAFDARVRWESPKKLIVPYQLLEGAQARGERKNKEVKQRESFFI